MKRLARWTLTALTVLSLLLCVATAWLGIRSYFVLDSLSYNWPSRSLGVETARGKAALVSASWSGDWDHPQEGLSWTTERPAIPWWRFRWDNGPPREWAGFGTRSKTVSLNGTHYTKTLEAKRAYFAPMWPISVTFVLPSVGWLCRRHRRRPSAGHCVRCGYDLTGNVSGICPECGTAVEKRSD